MIDPGIAALVHRYRRRRTGRWRYPAFQARRRRPSIWRRIGAGLGWLLSVGAILLAVYVIGWR